MVESCRLGTAKVQRGFPPGDSAHDCLVEIIIRLVANLYRYRSDVA